MIPVPIKILRRDTIQIIDLKFPYIIEIEIALSTGTETTQMIEIINTKITDHEIIQITHQTIEDQIIIHNNSQNRNSKYQNKLRKYSQSPHRNNTRYQNS